MASIDSSATTPLLSGEESDNASVDGNDGDSRNILDNRSDYTHIIVAEEKQFTDMTFGGNSKRDKKKRGFISRRLRTPIREIQTRSKSTWKKFKNFKITWDDVKDTLLHIFPFWQIHKTYNMKRDFPNDLIAGMTIGIMHIPQGMAYGMLTLLPPVYGLYTSFFPVLTYFFFGSSRHISMGTFAVVSLMVGSVVDKGVILFNENHANSGNLTLLNDTSTGIDNEAELLDLKVGLALSVTLVVGIFQLLMGLFRLGFLTTFLSDPLISGFTSGAAIHVFSSQVSKMFGIKMGRYRGAFKLIYAYRDFFSNLTTINPVTTTASIVCVFLLILIKEGINNNRNCKRNLKVPIPIELMVIIIATLLSHYSEINKEFGVAVVGEIPTGFPPPYVGQLRHIPDVIGDAVALAFVAFSVSYAMAKILADKHNYRINADQELVANGMCNLLGSTFNAFVSAGSISRSLVQENVGGKTQITSLIGGGIVFLVLVTVGHLFRDLPTTLRFGCQCGLPASVGWFLMVIWCVAICGMMPLVLCPCVLAAIVIVSLRGMLKQIKEMKRLWRLAKNDFSVWVVAFLATVILDVDSGLLVGVTFSLLNVLRETQRPNISSLGRVPNTDAYKETKTCKATIQLTGFYCTLDFGTLLAIFGCMLGKLSAYAKEMPGIKIFRYETNLYFANTEHFRTQLYDFVGVFPRDLWLVRQKIINQANDERTILHKEWQHRQWLRLKYKSGETDKSPPEDEPCVEVDLPRASIHSVVLDLSIMSSIDSVGVKNIAEIIKEYRDIDIMVYLAVYRADIRETLRRSSLYRRVENERIFFTVHDAISHILQIHPDSDVSGTRIYVPPTNTRFVLTSENAGRFVDYDIN